MGAGPALVGDAAPHRDHHRPGLSLRDITAGSELAREPKRVFRRDQLVSTTLQQALVLRRRPAIAAGLRLSARHVLGDDVAFGGDWFDAIQIENEESSSSPETTQTSVPPSVSEWSA